MFTQINTPKLAKYKGNGAINSHNYGQPRTGSVAWFNDCVEKSKSDPFSVIATITPDLAKHILENNDSNRPITQSNLLKISTDIKNGNWRLNGEAIIISDDGQLNDGQHRLLAVGIAELPIETVLFFGASRDSRYTVDMGTARNTGHYLSMEGVKNSNNIASAAKLLLQWKRNAHTHAEHIAGTKQDVRNFYHEHRTIIDNACQAVAYKSFASTVGVSSTLAAYVILHEVNPSACEEFFAKLMDGDGLRKGSAILQARTHFLSIRQERLVGWEKLELFLKYWNAWRRNKQLLRNYHVSGEWPKIEG
jgi:hypothetical protein